MGSGRTDVRHSKNILILSLAVLLTYLNATGTGALVLDDMTLINSIRGSEPSLSLFYSGNGPQYFRPLVYLSYFIDQKLYGSDPVGMHFVNIMIHLCNSILVYLVALHLVTDDAAKGRTAMVAALLFGLHPVNSEAVIWISSRYDLLGCFFMLTCLLLIVRHSTSWPAKPLALLLPLFLASLLSKESAILLPVAAAAFIFGERQTFAPRNAGAIMAPLILSLLLYLYLRNGLHIAVDRGISTPLETSSDNGVGATLVQCSAAIGFYVKKMLYPFPLSFAISSVNTPPHLILSIPLLAVAAVLFVIRSDLRFPLALTATALVPPLYAMVGSLAWTPYAERYLYIPMVGFALLVALLSSRHLERLTPLLPICIALCLAVATALRVSTWTEPIAFWQDTISKSPRFGAPHLLLAAELLSAGRLDEAERHLNRARELGISRANQVTYAKAVQNALTAARTRKSTP